VTPDLSLVLVTWRSSTVAPAAVAGFRSQARNCGCTSEVVIVDHSEDEREEARLRALAPEHLLVRPNRGYAAGVNAGVAAAAGGTLLVGNPDIEFAPGSVRALLDALAEGWDIAGPQFRLAGWLFPPADLQTPGEHLRRWLAGRSRFSWGRQLRRELGRWRSVWDASGPVPVPTLSGALLVFRRATFERVGPWDESYFLYFEEADWLRRAALAGLRAAVVPRALVEHRWAHAADPDAHAGVFSTSRRRFLSKQFGVRGRLAAALPPPAKARGLAPLPASVPELAANDVLWLLSPSPLGFPAAGMPGDGSPPVEAMAAFLSAHGRTQALALRAVDRRSGRPRGAWVWSPREQ
jgi:N-acetylglucosaminyl-diphospho-decaprenol L-rhamnosyltransferase